jgi:hypothetical protein
MIAQTNSNRQALHDLIDRASEEDISFLYELMAMKQHAVRTANDLQELDKRRQRHLDGQSNSYSFQRVEERISIQS